MIKGLALLAAQEMGGAVRRRARALGFYAGAAVVAGAAAVYGLNALHDWLSLHYTPMLASLSIAGGLLALAIILAILGAVQKRGAQDNAATATAALVALPAAARGLGGLGRLAPGTLATLGVLAAGALVGRHLSKTGR